MSVFISWAGADRELKNVIVSKFQEENIPYWESDEHCTSDFSEECIRNIKRSSVFVVIVSDASMSPSSYVFNEVIQARACEGQLKLNIIVFKTTDSDYTDRFAMQLNHISDANFLTRLQKAGAESSIDTLVKRVKRLLDLRENGVPEKPWDVNLPKLVGSQISLNHYDGYFVSGSRDETTLRVDQAFKDSNTIILSELFGFGKRSFIRQYVQAHPFNSAIEIDALNTNLYDFFLNGLQFSNVSEEAFASKDENSVLLRKFELLGKLRINDIIVIHNIDIENEPNEFIIRNLKNLKCKVVLITQNYSDAYDDYIPIITVGRMNDEALIELFFHYFDRANRKDRSIFIPHLVNFFNEIGGHTKTIEITGNVLSEERWSDNLEVIKYLTNTESKEQPLLDNIVNRLSSLMSLQSFTKDETDTLLLIALLATPAISINELKAIMQTSHIGSLHTVYALNSHRWITLNEASGLISIEPIIAKICVSKLLSDYSVPNACFTYLSSQFNSIASKANSSVKIYLNRLENFFHLFNWKDLVHICKICQNILNEGTIPSELVNSIEQRYKELKENQNDNTYLSLSKEAFEWALHILLPFLKRKNNFLLGLDLNLDIPYGEFDFQDFIKDVVGGEEEATDLLEFVEDLFEDHDNEELTSLMEDQEISILDSVYYFCIAFYQSMSNKDYHKMSVLLNQLLEFLGSFSTIEEEVSNVIIGISKIFYSVCIYSGTYQPGLDFLEKLLSLNLPCHHKYQLAIKYADLILNSGSDDDVFEVLDYADLLIDDIIKENKLSQSELIGLQKEGYVLKALSYVYANDIENALAAFQFLINLGDVRYNILEIIYLSEKIVEQLLSEGMFDEAEAFITEYGDLLNSFSSEDSLTEKQRESLESILLLPELIAKNESISTESYNEENRDYYKKYANDKGKFTTRLTMMKYERIANGVKKYDFSSLTDAELTARSNALRERAKSLKNKDEIFSEAFALVSEAGFRTLGYRHHFVQYVGACAMLDGKFAEILNGEGKTYVIALVAYVNSLFYDKVFIIDSSEYLSNRNHKWMAGLYDLLGLTTKVTKDRSVLDLSKEKIIYMDLSNFCFSFLNRESIDVDKQKDLSKYSIIVDEADTVLIESASQSYGYVHYKKASPNLKALYDQLFIFAKNIYEDAKYYTIKRGNIVLTPLAKESIEDTFSVNYRDISDSKNVLEIERILYLALHSLKLEKSKDYIVKNRKIYVEDESAGGLIEMRGERAYFVALKENVASANYIDKLSKTTDTTNKIYVYGIFNKVGSVVGTSATMSSFKKELKDLYGFEVIPIPPAKKIQRVDNTCTLYTKKEYKDEAICDLIVEKHAKGQPILLVVKNIRESLYFSEKLTTRGIKHRVLNAENSEDSPEMLANAGVLGSVLIATQLANRGVDIKLGGNPERITLFEMIRLGYDYSSIESLLYTSVDEDVKESNPTYRKYLALLEKNKLSVTLNRAKVMEAGGLVVIATQPYNNMRIIQQIRGRAGRQGEVGESYLFESVDDDFIKQLPNHAYLKKTCEVSGDKIISASIIDLAMDRLLKKIHRVVFQKMMRMVVTSNVIEEANALLNKFSTEDFDKKSSQLISYWVNNEINLKALKDLINEEDIDSDSVIVKLFLRNQDVFTNTLFLKDKLTDVVKDTIKQAVPCYAKMMHERYAQLNMHETSVDDMTLTISLLFRCLDNAKTEYLTKLEKLTNYYNDNQISERDYVADSQKLLHDEIALAIDKWLSSLLNYIDDWEDKL